MRLGLRELRRNPGRFVVATGTLSLLAILLFFLGALLDGLLQLSTGAYQAQPGQVVVMSANAKGVLASSQVNDETRDEVLGAASQVSIGAYAELSLGARLDGRGERDLISVRLRGYELAPAGLPTEPPAEGEVWADPDLGRDVAVGDILALGPGRAEVRVVGLLERADTPSLGGLWGSMETWRSIAASARPGVELADDFSQALIVDLGADADEAAVAQLTGQIGADERWQGFTIEDAGNAIPGVEAQRTTFNQIIAVTTAIALVVIALFFALLTAERVGLYGVLKALGTRSSTLFAGLAAQAIAITLLATIVGLGMIATAHFTIPPGAMPFAVTWPRLATATALLLASAVIGSAVSLRSVLRIDPAQAIGG